MKYVYRIVNAILGALTFVSAFFVGILKIQVSLSDSTWETIKSLVSAISSSTELNDGGYALVEEFSINRVINLINGNDELSGVIPTSGQFLWPEIFKPINVKLAFFAAFFVLMLLTGLFIIVWSCISNKRIPNIIAGAAGIAFDIGFIITFKMWATPIADGTIDIGSWISDLIFGNSDVLTGTLGTIVSTLAGTAMDSAFTIDLALCGIQNAMLFVFIGVLMWTAIFYLVELGDKKTADQKLAVKAYAAAVKEEKAADKALRTLRKNDSPEESEVRKAELALEKAKKASKAAYAKTEDGKAAEIKAAKKKAKAEKKAAKAAEKAEAADNSDNNDSAEE